MGFLNVEIKARCEAPDEVEYRLMQKDAEYRGLDHQVDTYFRVPKGRLKLREGNIENALIHYRREDLSGPKTSEVSLYRATTDPALREVLAAALGVLTVVDKHRKIFFIGNVKFHLDRVAGLGSFVEIEAIDRDGTIGREKLQQQCDHYMEVLGIGEKDLVAVSYSDMLMKEKD